MKVPAQALSVFFLQNNAKRLLANQANMETRRSQRGARLAARAHHFLSRAVARDTVG